MALNLLFLPTLLLKLRTRFPYAITPVTRHHRQIALAQRLKSVFLSVGFIVVAAFIVRMAYCWYILGIRDVTMPDNHPFGAETGAISAAIASGRGFSSPLLGVASGPTAWLTPVYPYLLAGIFKLFGIFSFKSSLIIRTIDMAFSSFVCWPVYDIGKKAFGRHVGAASAWLWAFLPAGIYYSVVWVWDTALAVLCMTLLFAATLHIRGRTRLSWWIGYGALWAFSAMVNATVLSLLPFLALWALWPLRHEFLRTSKLALLAAFVFIAGMAPWTVRNYLVFHKFIPLRSNFGLELWLSNNPEVPDTWAGYLHPTNDREESAKYVRMTEIPYMEEKQSEAFTFMRSHPYDTMRFFFRRFEDNWMGTWDAPADQWRFLPLSEKAALVWNCLFSLLAFAGTFLANRTKRESALPFTTVMLVFPLVFYVTHTNARYRHPMDAIMCLLAIFALRYPLSNLAAKRASSPRRAAQSALGVG
jgi:4-amino-4-deoxy-L-arabinose transferase-like glycosyltransferase